MRFLYLASASQSRQKLLTLAQIPYHLVSHTSDECGIDVTQTFNDYVLAIAQHKMERVVLDRIVDTSTIFVLTADTLIRTLQTKQILGKPTDYDDAKRMLALIRKESVEVVTGCCLEKKDRVNKAGNTQRWNTRRWNTVQSEHWVTGATLEFCVDEEMVDLFLEKTPQALHACGAGIIENFGFNFLRRVNGSYTAILGLPIFELRQALNKLGFFS